MNPGEISPRNPVRPAASIEAEAARWIARRDDGLSAAEEAELAAWRGQDPHHEAAFQRFDAMAAALGRARQSGAITDIKTGLATRARRRRTRRTALAGVAAALLLALGVTSYVRRVVAPPAPGASLRYVAVIRHLPDGSTVELNRGARLAIHFDAAFRRVELVQGEALFHVAKDAKHPFIVRAGEVDVRAVGTAFSVRLDPKQVQVLVTEGKVGVDAAGGGRSLLPGEHAPDARPLLAGDCAVVAPVHPTLAVVTRVTPDEMEHELAWRNPRIDFDGTDLALAVQQMNERNAVHIVLAGGDIGRLHISGSFSASDPRTFARLAAETFGLSSEEQGGTIVLRQP